MFRLTKLAVTLLLMTEVAYVFAQAKPPADSHPPMVIGRTATPKEIAAWDIDVRPDFKGLPPGSGSVLHGQAIWESTCAACHGTFGESNHVFSPIVGGTTADDIRSGHVAALRNNTQPERTTLMKVATVSTLWDYIHRAMPWNAPKTLSNDDVYAVLAYILNLGEIVPDDFVLSDKTIVDVQKRMPNRNGMTRDHGLWDIKGKPDVKNVACMKNCSTEGGIASSLPDSERGTHGNLADQNRTFGEVRGQNSAPSRPPATAPVVSAGRSLVTKYSCVSCHGMTTKIVGPGYAEVAARYKDKVGGQDQLIAKIKHGGSGSWGAIPMPAQPQVSEEDVKTIAKWIMSGAQ